MPPRLSKRQQREQEEIAALAATASPAEHAQKPASQESESEDASEPISKRPVGAVAGGFSILESTTVDESSEGESQDKAAPAAKKKTKKKKKKTPTTRDTPVVSTPSKTPEPVGKAAKATGKKGKGKGKQEDDLDRALSELSLKYSDITIPDPSTTQVSAPALTSALQTMRSLLALQPKFLDSDAEMRRFFGSKVISAAESSTSSNPGPQQPRGPVARSVLCRPQSSWPPAAMRDGLTMRILTAEETKAGKGESAESNWMIMPGDKWFTVEHSPAYRWDQAQFIQVVGMLDPNNLFTLMRESFWHVDTLLQIGEVYRAQDDYSVSSDFTSRALFAYERSFSGSFNLTNGASRLDFRRVENRSLFLALHRTILYLERRGTMRTAFEFARLLWALDPWGDPQGALMHLDFLAVKAEQYEWFLETEEAWEEIRKERPSLPPLNARPGWKWSKALILKGLGVKKGGGEKKATEELKQAVAQFPEVLASLISLVGVNLPAQVRLPSPLSRWDSSNESQSSLWLLSSIYAHRSISLWKIPETLAWLNATIQTHGPLQQSSSNYRALYSHPSEVDAFVKSVIRHAIISDMKPLASFVGSLHALHGPQDGFDIAPPQGEGVTIYDEAYFSTASAETAKRRREGQVTGERRRRGGPGAGIEIDPTEFLQMLEDILAVDEQEPRRNEVLRALQDGPGATVVAELERWVRQHPDFAEQFPHARAFLLQPAAQRPRPDPPHPRQNNNAAPFIAPMPGAFAGDVVEQQHAHRPELREDDDEDDEDSDGEGPTPMLPIRIARGLMNMIWGGGGDADSDSESDDDDAVANNEDDHEVD